MIHIRRIYLESFQAIVQQLQGVMDVYSKVKGRFREHKDLIGELGARHDETDGQIVRIQGFSPELDDQDGAISEAIQVIESNVAGLQDSDGKIF